MIKNFHIAIIGSAVVAAFAWFCFSCSEKSDATEKDKPEQTAAVNPDLAGKGHNDCLDIFYDKWQALKNRKSKQTRAGDGNEDLPPDPGDDDEITKEELEEILVETLVEGLHNMDVPEEEKEEILDGINSAMTYCNENQDEEIPPMQWSQEAIDLQSQLDIILNAEYENVQDMISAIKSYEASAHNILSEKEYNTLMVSTSIMRHTLSYWDKNWTAWIPQTRAGEKITWHDFSEADIEGAKKAISFKNAFWGGTIARVISYAIGISNFSVVAAIVGSYSVSMSITTAVVESECKSDEIDIEIDDQIDFCCSVVESALEELSLGSEDTEL